jgi:6-phospho-3-hexuloisomerase
MAEKAKSLNAKVALITINPDSTVGVLADVIVRINAPSPKAAKEGDIVSVQPMGNLFEQSLLLFLDISVMMLMDKKSMTAEEMFKLHANLE